MSTEFVFEKATINANDRGVYLCIKLPFEAREPAREFVADLKEGKQYVATLHERKAKRSLDQNGYFWTLCNQLSAVLKMPPKDIYREYVKDVGGNYEITPIKADNVKHWVEIWEAQGIGFIAEDMGESKLHLCASHEWQYLYTRHRFIAKLNDCLTCGQSFWNYKRLGQGVPCHI